MESVTKLDGQEQKTWKCCAEGDRIWERDQSVQVQTNPWEPEIVKTLWKQKTNSLETRHTTDANIGLNMSLYNRN